MSIGTLLAYTIVSASVIILRYKPDSVEQEKLAKESDNLSISTTSTQSDNLELSLAGRLKPEFWWLSNLIGGCGQGGATSAAVFFFTCCSVAFCIQIHTFNEVIKAGKWWPISNLAFFLVCLLGCLFVIFAHNQNKSTGNFRVPWVPFIPALSILCNVGLMVHLDALTWIRFIVWMILGLLVYFLYGIRYSKESEVTSTYSMLMTSSEANKGQWGAMNPRDESAGYKSPSDQQPVDNSAVNMKPTGNKKKSKIEDTEALIDDDEVDD